jgi:hypothetical protein
VTDQPRHRHPRPGVRHPRWPLPAARRALTVLGALLLSPAAIAPAASATPAPPEPPVGPPPPPAVSTPGLPLWAVLVILGGTIALSAATTLITLALQPTSRRRPQPPAPTAPPRASHRPATHQRTSAAIPAKHSGP